MAVGRAAEDTSDANIGASNSTSRETPNVEEKPPAWLRRDNGIGACFLYRRAVYDAIGEYDPRAELAEDYDYWLRVARRFRMQRLARPLYYYREHPGSITARHGRPRIARTAASVRRTGARVFGRSGAL